MSNNITTMKARSILLGLALLTGLGADTPPRGILDKDMIEILKVARKYRPGDFAMAEVALGPIKDTAYVRYSVRNNGQYVVTSVVTVKKTSKGWQVESSAR